MKIVGKRLRSTSNNQSPLAMKTTTNDDDYNFPIQSNYKKLSNFLKESKAKQQQQNRKKKTNHLECNCWVCKLLDSSSITNETTSTAAAKHEAYNIVSDTGDSIFYDPLLLPNIIINDDDNEDKLIGGQIFVAEDKIRDIVQDELAKHFNGVTLNKNEY